MSQVLNTESIESYRNNFTNVLITNNVTADMVDNLPCSLLIQFDEILNIKTFFQCKGRENLKDAEIIYMYPEEDRYKMLIEVDKFKKTIQHTFEIAYLGDKVVEP